MADFQQVDCTEDGEQRILLHSYCRLSDDATTSPYLLFSQEVMTQLMLHIVRCCKASFSVLLQKDAALVIIREAFKPRTVDSESINIYTGLLLVVILKDFVAVFKI